MKRKKPKSFVEVWCDHRQLPRLYSQEELRVHPYDQFMHSLLTTLPSLPDTQVQDLLKALGQPVDDSSYVNLCRLRVAIIDALDALPDGSGADPNMIDDMIEEADLL